LRRGASSGDAIELHAYDSVFNCFILRQRAVELSADATHRQEGHFAWGQRATVADATMSKEWRQLERKLQSEDYSAEAVDDRFLELTTLRATTCGKPAVRHPRSPSPVRRVTVAATTSCHRILRP